MSPLLLAMLALVQLHRLLTPHTWISLGPDGVIRLTVDPFADAVELARNLGLSDPPQEEKSGDLVHLSWVGQVLIDEHAAVWVAVSSTGRVQPPLAAVPPTAPIILRPDGVTVPDQPTGALQAGVA